MGYTIAGLKDKIMEMYPELSRYGCNVGVEWNDDKSVYIIRLRKDSKDLTTYLEKKDADQCMDGLKCVYLGVQVEQFIKNFAAA